VYYHGVTAVNRIIRILIMNFLKLAHELADQAAAIARSYFRAPVEITLKTGGYPVTAADLAIEAALRQTIMATFPTHGILGEEYGEAPFQGEYLWVIDPIDGTTSFACGKPTFCTLIALLQNGKPILSIIDQPITRDRWVGQEGKPTTWNGIPCVTRTQPGRIRFSCTTPAMFKTAEERTMFDRISSQASVISYGGDAYAYGLLAGGCIDLILEADLQYYDIAALIPIIEGAGGVITDWEGQALNRENFKGKVIAAAATYLLPS
jgi:histidinol phosphatase-like enzyme (inositol monophosphatase family)